MDQSDGWLDRARTQVQAYFERAVVGPTVEYSHPLWRTRGFSAILGEPPNEQRELYIIAVARLADTLCLRCTTVVGAQSQVRALISSLTPAQHLPVSSKRFIVYDSQFTCPGEVSPPKAFRFANTGECSLVIEWGNDPPPFAEPDWGTLFSFAPNSATEVVLRQSHRSTAGSRRGVSAFDWAEWQAVVHEEYAVELYFARASATFGGRSLYLTFRAQRDIAAARSALLYMLDSFTPEASHE